MSGFLLQSGRLIQVKTIEIARRDLAKGDHDRLIEVTIEIARRDIAKGDHDRLIEATA